MRAAVVAWGLWLVDLCFVAVVVVLAPQGGGDPWGTAGALTFIAVFSTTGALVASRVPRNPIGWLMCLAALAFSIGGTCATITESAARTGQDGPAVVAAGLVGSFVWVLGIGPAGTLLLLLFPDGHLVSPRWRPVAWAAVLALVLSVVGSALRPGDFEDTGTTNPIGVEPAAKALDLVGSAALLLLLAVIVASCASLVVRYRRVDDTQRRQLRWLAWSLPVMLAWLVASLVVGAQPGERAVDVSNGLLTVGLSFLPVAIALAILRHRLYDIDLVIKRTVTYSVVTAVLVATYLLLVLVLQPLLRPATGDTDLAVAASTLAVAALFRPLRARVQQAVDRRFFRARYDATVTVAGFSDRLRQELDLATLGEDLCSVVETTVQPEHVSLWLRGDPTSTVVTIPGRWPSRKVVP